jgi:hypothetical protein
LILVILALAWALVLIPPLLRSRSEGRPSQSVSHFRRQLNTLQRTRPASFTARTPTRAAPIGRSPSRVAVAPRPVAAARMHRLSRVEVKRRRQNVLLTLLGATFVSGTCYLGLGIGLFLPVACFFLFCTVVYMVLLVRLRQAAEMRSAQLWWQQAA